MSLSLFCPQSEQRISHRFSFPWKLFCYLNIQDDKMIGPVEVRNISEGGIGLVLAHNLTLVRPLAVSFFNKRQQSWSRFPVAVVYTQARPEGDCFQGYAFSLKLSPEEVLELL